MTDKELAKAVRDSLCILKYAVKACKQTGLDVQFAAPIEVLNYLRKTSPYFAEDIVTITRRF